MSNVTRSKHLLWWEDNCICYFSVSVIKDHDHKQLKEEVFFGLCFHGSREFESSMADKAWCGGKSKRWVDLNVHRTDKLTYYSDLVNQSRRNTSLLVHVTPIKFQRNLDKWLTEVPV